MIEGSAEVRIGKKGFTEETKKEIERHLKEHEVIKIRLLDRSCDRLEVAQLIAKETKSELLDIRGRTFILKKDDSS
ncbi:YhbY family RNA-binding protein [Metallosphaera tengchongensis]|uniref:YhbY family RNA-binding protein n=1 Tax=Metallosphaera tengchongensis TaxID=1532350 RepID=A0A6N0NYF4_9CREN|nr:YhbY family RNA-binding protein [Metallosphaera tengchongensis]